MASLPDNIKDDWQFRAGKARQARDLYAACFDLLNDFITGPMWLKRLGDLANCRSVTCIWWRTGHPDTATAEASGTEFKLSPAWFKLLDDAIAGAAPDQAGIVDEMNGGAGKLLDDPLNPLFTPDRLITCLDWYPARVIIILSDRESGSDWQSSDRGHVNVLLPIIRKSVLVKKRLSWQADVMDMQRKVFDEIPCGFINLMPSNEMISINRMAQEILAEGSCLQIKPTGLKLQDARLDAEFKAQLATIENLPAEQLGDFVWCKNLSGMTGPKSLMATLLAFSLDDWRPESTGHDRVAVMILERQGARVILSEAQLREFYQITKAQARVLHAIMNDLSVEQAADMLHISVNTARSHLRAMYARLGVDGKSQLLQMVGSNITGKKS